MSHFLLYIPEASAASPKVFEEIGLGDFHQGAEGLHSPGPDGRHGMLCAWRRGNAPMHFNASEQTWIPAVPNGDAAAGRYWVGIWNDSPPVPKDLVRPYPYRGRMTALGDGNSWLFPESRELPRDFILADDGTLKYELQRKFHAFHMECLDWLECIDSQREKFVAPFSELWPFLVRALALNYRMLPELASHLRLFTTYNIRGPLFAVTGIQKLLDEYGDGHDD